MINGINKNAIVERLREVYPYASAEFIEAKAAKLLLCQKELQPSITEWLEKAPPSNGRIGKYSVSIVLKLRGDRDIPSAILALNEYLVTGKEEQLWRSRR